MKARFATVVAVVWSVGMSASSASGVVDLVLAPKHQGVSVGTLVEISLYAVSNDGTVFSGLDVLLTWDPTALDLLGVVDGGILPWFISGFLSDEFLDRLNNDCAEDVFCVPYTGLPFNDGDAMYQAGSFGTATATPEGALIATFQFTALTDIALTNVVLVSELGGHSATQVLQPGGDNVTGDLGSAGITIGAADIPTVSEWGVVAMAVLILALGSIVVRRTQRQAA